MKGRCQNPNNHKYPIYGARGIKVCDRWQKFENFLADMGERPSKKYSIDRIDNDGHYTPDNCRWADRYEQQNNTRRNRLITINGETKTMSQWGRQFGISPDTIWNRIVTLKWDDVKSVVTPIHRKHRNKLTKDSSAL
jgi:hypothetical protein